MGRGMIRSGLGVLATVAAATQLAISHAEAQAPATGGGLLFVQTSAAGQLQETRGKSLRLKLIDPDPTVHAFSDRPARFTELEPLADFVRLWGSYGFKRAPPNAAIEVDGRGERQDVLIVELSRPKLTRSGDLSYRVRPLEPSKRKHADLRRFLRRADDDLPGRLGRTSLFIDDASDAVIGVGVSFSAGAAASGRILVENAGVASFGSLSGTTSYSSLGSRGVEVSTGGAGSASLTIAVNPLGDCVVLTYEPIFGAFSQLSAYPTEIFSLGTPISPGTNKVPITETGVCS